MKSKIVFVTDTLSSGGAERVISVLANAFCQEFEVSIICLRRRTVAYSIDAKIHIVYGDDHCANFLSKCMWLRSQLRTYDLVIAFMVPVFVMTLACMLFSKTPIIISERNDPMAASRLRRMARRFLLCRMQHMVVQTMDIKRYFPARYQSIISIIVNPIAEQFIWQGALKCRKENKIVTVGRLDPQKNQKMLIDAFAAFSARHPEWYLEIYGEGPLRQELENYIRAKGANVRLMGISSDIATKILSARVFALTSVYEGMSNAMLEAMFVGLPVVCTKVSGARDVIKDNENGFFVDNATELEQRFDYIAEHPDVAHQIGLQASVDIKALGDEVAVVDQWRQLIKRYL